MIIVGANFGIFVAFFAGTVLSYHQVPLLFIPLSILTAVGFMFLLESPAYLAKKGEIKAAEKSLQFYRGFRGIQNIKNEVYMEDLLTLKQSNDEEPVESTSNTFEDLSEFFVKAQKMKNMKDLFFYRNKGWNQSTLNWFNVNFLESNVWTLCNA